MREERCCVRVRNEGEEVRDEGGKVSEQCCWLTDDGRRMRYEGEELRG